MVFPAELPEPKSLNSETGNCRRSKSGMSSCPTAHVAHTIQIFIIIKLKIKTPLQVLRAELRIKKTLFYPPRFGGFLVVLVMRRR
jgi:hypothetical protein